jgi:hypothetical protein
MKDARNMCTNSVNVIGLNNMVMSYHLISQLIAVITLKVMGYGLNARQDTSLGHRMELFQVQLLLSVGLEDVCNPFITELTY